jgi:hypothetical protein
LSVNGSSSLFVGDLPSVSSPIGGVSSAVSTSPVRGGKVGRVALTGLVKTLRIGGQELWIDRLCVSSGPDAGVPSEKFLTYTNSNLEIIPGEYLVMFDSALVSETAVPALANSLVAGTAGTVDYLFTKSLHGFVAKNLTDAWANAVSVRPDVSLVRKDFRIYGKEDRGGPFDPVPWNLDRVDQRAPFSLDRDYRLKTGSVGTTPPVPIYILDNGVYQNHLEFMGAAGSRVENVADLTGTNFARCVLAVPDANHGTRAASIAAGVKLGITPTLIKNVKILDRSPFGTSCTVGSPTRVAMGLEETYKHMVGNNITKAVVNLSLGWYGTTPDVATAISNLQKQGAVVVAAGGNENQDAAGLTPANLPNVLAVGATTQSDARAIFSNFGSTIALWAPGDNIKAADWPMVPDPTATDFASGTSDAAPHVAGAAALLWQQNPTMSASQVMSALRGRATLNMLTNLGAGSNNALLYVGEDAPTQGSTHLINRSGRDGDLLAVKASWNQTRVYVAGGEISGASPTHGPYAYAGYDIANLNSGPIWQVGNATTSASQDCVDIHASDLLTGAGRETYAYFGCMGTHNGAREAVVIATQEDNKPLWQQPMWLGPGSVIDGVTAGIVELGDGHAQFLVFAIGTRPTATGTEVFITSLDIFDGHQVGSVVLTAPGFNEQIHRAVDLVLIDVPLDSLGTTTTTELVAATYSDPPGADKTFLWKLDPQTLQVKDWREVPVPSLATNGMFATALAVQPLEINGLNIVIPGEVFLATMTAVKDGGRTVPWGYIYRLNPNRVTASPIEVVKEAFISSLWSEEGDLYFAGMTTRTFPPGNLLGIPKPGASPDYDAFLGKSEGIVNRRRWMITFNSPGAQNNSGYGGYGAKKGYIVGSDSSIFYVVEYAVY